MEKRRTLLEERFVCVCVGLSVTKSMSARRKHVRAHARDVEVEVDLENGDRVCRVEEIKGGNVIEVSKHIINPFSSVVRV